MLSVYLAAFQAGRQLLSLGGSPDTSAFEISISLKRIENALEETNSRLRNLERLEETEAERSILADATTKTSEITTRFRAMADAVRGEREISRRDIEAAFAEILAIEQVLERLILAISDGLGRARHNGGLFEYYIIPTSVACDLGVTLTALLSLPELLIGQINSLIFRTRHQIDYLEGEAEFNSRKRLHLLRELLSLLNAVAPKFEDRWLTEALRIAVEAGNANGIAILPLKAILTKQRVFAPNSRYPSAAPASMGPTLYPVITMCVERARTITVSADGRLTLVEAKPIVSFYADTWWKAADKRRAKLEMQAGGRSVRIKASRSASAVKQKGKAADLAKANPLQIPLKGDRRIVAYELYLGLEKDLAAMEQMRMRGVSVNETVTWNQLLGIALAAAERLSFVRQGVNFLSAEKGSIEVRLASPVGASA